MQSRAQKTDQPRLRGMMVTSNIDEPGLRTLAGWGANHVRWQLTWAGFPNSPADFADEAAYRKWLEGALAHLDKMLPLCRELGIKVVIDLHTPPGGRLPNYNHKLFVEKAWQDVFIAVWKEIAERYKNETAVWGYDLFNEPKDEMVLNAMDWPTLAANTALQVRNIDKTHAIIIEAQGGDIEPLERLQPINVEGIVYSFHMYVPHSFTHQRIYSGKKKFDYPGRVGLKWWNKDKLRHALQGIIDWQRRNNTQIYVGEFSAIRWAPGESACRYLDDCIQLFEEAGWSWDYHAFREYDGWSVEHDGDQNSHNKASSPTCRQQVLVNGFSKNTK